MNKRSHHSSLRGLPDGPGESPLVQLMAWIYRPTQFLKRCQRRFGDVFTVRFPRFPPMVVIADPSMIKEVFTADPGRFPAGYANVMLRSTLGDNSLLLLDDPRHLAERKLMMPPFHGERVEAQAKIMREATHHTIDAWSVGPFFSLHPEMKKISLEVILRAVFGFEDLADAQRLGLAVDRLFHLGNHPLFLMMMDSGGNVRGREIQQRIPFSPWSVFRRARDEVHRMLLREISSRRESASTRHDVMSMLLSARDEHGIPLDERALCDEMLTLLVAGHKTTATTLTWVVYHLLSEPLLWEKVRTELENGSSDGLDCVVKETLRLSPTIPLVLRRTRTRQRLGDHDIPEDVLIAPAIYLAHRRPEAWPDPERFDPQRFREKQSPFEYFPFGGGTRRCLGSTFATCELRVVLTEILKRVQLELPRGYRGGVVRRGITFALSDGLPVRLRKKAHHAGE